MVCAEVCAEVLSSCDFSIFLAPFAPCAFGIRLNCLKMSRCMSLTCMFFLIALPKGRARFGPHVGGPRGGPRRSRDRLGSDPFSSCGSGSLFGPFRGPLGVVLERLWPHFGPSWAHFVSSWARLGSFLATPCGILESYNPYMPISSSTDQPFNPWFVNTLHPGPADCAKRLNKKTEECPRKS